MKLLETIFNARWRWVTLFAASLFVVFILLGIWQIGRHAQREAFYKRINDLFSATPVPLTANMLNDDLTKLEYHAVTVVGAYDHANQVGLRNQVVMDNLIGTRLLTPLILNGTKPAVLIDRGWIPQAQAAPANWKSFDEPGVVTIKGFIRITQAPPGSAPSPAGSIQLWNRIDVAQIATQLPYPLLPVYIQQAPDPTAPTPTPGQPFKTLFRTMPELMPNDNSNIAYATQWFLFALVIVFGYPYYVKRQEQKRAEPR
jgi:surfeit locus 1 family protein